jgi:hypothetical protein
MDSTSIEKDTAKAADPMAASNTAQLEVAPMRDDRAVWETRETYGPPGTRSVHSLQLGWCWWHASNACGGGC